MRNTLADTVELMNSKDYKERFIAEYHQTKIRYNKLFSFCHDIETASFFGKEAPKHDCPLELLQEQVSVMERYLEILEARADIEGVDLYPLQ